MTIKSTNDKKRGVFLVVVDSTEECVKAIDFASYYANAQGGYVALLKVMDQSSTMMSWQNIEERIKRELREQAEQMIWNSAGRIIENTGKIPMAYIKEGDRSDVIVQTVESNDNIVALVLASSLNSSKPGPLVDYFSGKGLARLPVPLIIVPGGLDMQEN